MSRVDDSKPTPLVGVVCLALVALVAAGCSDEPPNGAGVGDSAGDPPTTIAATWETYDSVDALAHDATLVAVVTMGPESRREPLVMEDGTQVAIDVIHTAQVERVLASDQALDSASIEVTYADFGGSADSEGNITPYREGERLVMFLVPLGRLAGVWAPLSANLGIFEFTSDTQLVNRGTVGAMAGKRISLDELARSVTGD